MIQPGRSELFSFISCVMYSVARSSTVCASMGAAGLYIETPSGARTTRPVVTPTLTSTTDPLLRFTMWEPMRTHGKNFGRVVPAIDLQKGICGADMRCVALDASDLILNHDEVGRYASSARSAAALSVGLE